MSTSGTDWSSLNDPLDEEEEESEEIEYEDTDSDFAPAVSLTSLQLTRRRSMGKGSLKKTAYLPIGNVDTDDLMVAPGPEEAAAPQMPAETAAAPREPEVPQAIPDSPPNPRQEVPANLFNYWKDLRQARRFPTVSDLDQDLITSQWPSSLLLRVKGAAQRPQIVKWTSKALTVAKPAPAPRQEKPIEYTPLMSEWIISLARRLFETGAPIHETESFASKKGEVSYRALVLPLSDDQHHVDHALFHIAHA